jgi:hypothetical protein
MSAHATTEHPSTNSQEEAHHRTSAVLESVARSYPANSVEASAIREAALAYETVCRHEHLRSAFRDLQVAAQSPPQLLDLARYRSTGTIVRFLAAIVASAWFVMQIGFAIWIAAHVPSDALTTVSSATLVFAYSVAALWLARFAARLYREQLRWRPLPRHAAYSGPPNPTPQETPGRRQGP